MGINLKKHIESEWEVNENIYVDLHIDFRAKKKDGKIGDFDVGDNSIIIKKISKEYSIKIIDMLKSVRIIHRDIKSDNILIIGDEIKFDNFYLSKLLINEFDKHFDYVGTSSYMAPEILLRRGAGLKSDIYSLGCVLFQMTGNELNFYDSSLKFTDDLSVYLKNIIQQCTHSNVAARFDSKSLVDHLFSNGIQINNQDSILSSTSKKTQLISPDFNDPLKVGTILDGVIYLSLPSFNNSIEPGSIPSSVKYLIFKELNQYLEIDSIPESVTYLDLGNKFDLEKNGENLPNHSISTLKCGLEFKKPIKSRWIPESVTNLILANYNIPLLRNSIGRNVTSLTFGNHFNDIESLTNLSESIINLAFGTDESNKTEISKYIDKSVTSLNITYNNSKLYKCIPHNENEWEFDGILGKDSYGKVRKALKNGQKYAIKTIKKHDFNETEVDIMIKLNGNYSMKFYGYGEDEKNFYIYMEYNENAVSISDKFKTENPSPIFDVNKFNKEEFLKYATEIAYALSQIHKLDVAHRDIKSIHIFVNKDENDETNVKFIDFGGSKEFSKNTNSNYSKIQGTDKYMAPEVLSSSLRASGRKSDVFSLGCVFIEMVGGSLKRQVNIMPTVPDKLPADIKDIIKQCIESDIYKRLTSEQLYESLLKIQNIVVNKNVEENYCQDIKVLSEGMIPNNAKNVTLPLYNAPINQKFIPNNVKYLALPSFELELTEYSIPHGIQHLSLPMFDKPIDIGVLPSSLKILELDSFNSQLIGALQYKISQGSLPSSLTKLHLGKFDQPFEKGLFPSSIRYLSLPSFNQKISPGLIPYSVINLSLPSFNHYFEPGSIPDSVTNLSFKKLNQDLEYDAIPPFVKYLDLGSEFDIQKYENNFPIKSVLTFICDFRFKTKVKYDCFPPSTTNLQLTNYNIPLLANSIPPNVISLTLGNEFDNIESLKPLSRTNVVYLTFGVTDESILSKIPTIIPERISLTINKNYS